MASKEISMAILTPEQRQEIQRAGGKPLKIEDPETHQVYVVIPEDVYRKLQESAAIDHTDPSLYEFGEFFPDR
jgi:hypothetical protein